MATTAIKAIVNASTFSVAVKDHEDPAKAGHYVQVSGGADKGCDMWVPWCTNPTDFLGAHYITLEAGGWPVRKYWMWQTGSAVVSHPYEDFSPYAARVLGAWWVGGERALLITPQSFRLAQIGI
jgi:hypothetical protein